MTFISVIVPTLNEETSLALTLDNIRTNSTRNDVEIIVSDAGSSDETVNIARKYADRIIESAPGRGRQMANGANVAKGDVLLFVHADTQLPTNYDQHIKSSLEQGSSWGRFYIRLSGKQHFFRIIETMINLRTRLTSVATGDQCIYISSELYKKCGGFSDIPIMEDILISNILSKYQRPGSINIPVITSSRRWEQRGIIRTILLMWMMRFLYFIGINPYLLAKIYR